MPTPYSDIFTKFNSIVEDNTLLSVLTDEELSELLEIFLSKSKSIYFKNCRKDLSDVDDNLKQFNETLSDEEIWILITGMRLTWVIRQLNKEEKLRDKLGNRDYSFHSPANLIDKLILLKKETEKELKNYVVDYSFYEFSGFN